MSKENIIIASPSNTEVKVLLAYLQAPTTLRGLVEQQTTLDTKRNCKGAVMNLTDAGLQVSFTDKGSTRQIYIIPYTNVKSMLLG